MSAPSIDLASYSDRDIRLLYLADSSSGFYPGAQTDIFPRKKLAAMLRDGLVSEWHPHNPVHKWRAITTPKGAEIVAAAREAGRLK